MARWSPWWAADREARRRPGHVGNPEYSERRGG
jgi:hypothetical protein